MKKHLLLALVYILLAAPAHAQPQVVQTVWKVETTSTAADSVKIAGEQVTL